MQRSSGERRTQGGMLFALLYCYTLTGNRSWCVISLVSFLCALMSSSTVPLFGFGSCGPLVFAPSYPAMHVAFSLLCHIFPRVSPLRPRSKFLSIYGYSRFRCNPLYDQSSVGGSPSLSCVRLLWIMIALDIPFSFTSGSLTHKHCVIPTHHASTATEGGSHDLSFCRVKSMALLREWS